MSNSCMQLLVGFGDDSMYDFNNIYLELKFDCNFGTSFQNRKQQNFVYHNYLPILHQLRNCGNESVFRESLIPAHMI